MKKKKKKPNKDLQKLAKRIKQLRTDQGYTNYEHFAFDHFIARTQYARYEQGEDLRFTSLLKLLRAFGISLSQFFAGFEGSGQTGNY
ncbi:MAG TPA: helix-turn-helix transcriptional regulator [Bacteroidia bacterium]|nr:helix-turn-helix transcriptional regulator [Bacteroidia bacterium]